MSWKDYMTLLLLSLGVMLFTIAWQDSPGYMDASYYCATGLQLASGKGFTEPFLWNYLDDPAGLPHPSHTYWMPLASMLAALGAVFFGSLSWSAARFGFLITALFIPPLTATLAYSLTRRRPLAITSGLLATFSGFYAPFLTATDTFGLYVVLGSLFLLTLSPPKTASRLKQWRFFVLGLLAGLMHLSRADGLVWLAVALIASWYSAPTKISRLRRCVVVLAGYLLMMTPWFIRNLLTFGTILAPGGMRTLWLTSYDQTFIYPPQRLTFAHWWANGLKGILKSRLWALNLNFQSTFAVQGEIFLFPFILWGLWHCRRDRRVQIASLSWGLTFLVMTFIFPFAGARGGFFHSGAALQGMWWALAPIGLEQAVHWISHRRKWSKEAEAQKVFRQSAVALAVFLTGLILWNRVLGGLDSRKAWGYSTVLYENVGLFFKTTGAQPNEVIIVADPPGFYLATGYPAIALPDGDTKTLLEVARRYRATWLVLEREAVTPGLKLLYDQPLAFPTLTYLFEMEGIRVFRIPP